MTTARLGREGKDYVLRVTGHAEYGYRGKDGDIVCAACSMLGQAFLAYCMDMGIRDMTEELSYSLEDGLEVRCMPKEGGRRELEGAVKMTGVGYRMLENRYPQNVRLITENS